MQGRPRALLATDAVLHYCTATGQALRTLRGDDLLGSLTRAVAYLNGTAERATVDSAYLLESAALACPGAFSRATLRDHRRAASRGDILGLLSRAPRLQVSTAASGGGSRRGSGAPAALVERGPAAAQPSVDPALLPWFDVRLSDRCLSDALSCELSEQCRSFETRPGAQGYTLTHQLLFFWFAHASACAGHAWAPLAPLPRRISELAARMYDEQAASRASDGFDDEQAERLALGVSLHAQGAAFLRRRWVRRLVRAQRAPGCWEEHFSLRSESLGDAINAVAYVSAPALLEPDCNLHTTALATYVLAAYGRTAGWRACGEAQRDRRRQEEEEQEAAPAAQEEGEDHGRRPGVGQELAHAPPRQTNKSPQPHAVSNGSEPAAACLQPSTPALRSACWQTCLCCRWDCGAARWTCC